MDKIIEVKHFHKHYKDLVAVDGIDFHVKPGELFAFLGPNGAGKSTTINTICTFLKPDEGEIFVNGYEVGKEDAKIQNCIGAVFQEGLLDSHLTVAENLKTRGALYGLSGKALTKSVNDAANLAEVQDLLNQRYGTLSGGQKRRCDIARALIHTPKILFLDEPTTGLDPQTRKHIWHTIRTIQNTHQTTVFLTTHYMEEASQADYILIIDNGKICAKGTPAELKNAYGTDHLYLSANTPNNVCTYLSHRNIRYKQTSNAFNIGLSSTQEALPILNDLKDEILDFEVIKGTMDDIFIAVTGKEIREC